MRLGRTGAAVAVMLATVGCAPSTGPRLPNKDVEAFRQRLFVGAALQSNISYLAAGDSLGPRLILVHGTPGSAKGWANYLIDPPAGVEVLALDRPGFGESGPEGAVTGLAEQAAAVVALLPSDGRKVILVGHSSGGPIIAWVAAQQPGRIAALVLLAAALDPQLEVIHPMQYVGAIWPIRLLLPRAIRNSNAELMALKPELQALRGMLGSLALPVIIVHGSADSLAPPANVDYMRQQFRSVPCIETRLLKEVGHFLPWNSEVAVRSAINWALAAAC